MESNQDLTTNTERYQSSAQFVLDELQKRGADQAEVMITDEAGYSLEVCGGVIDRLEHQHDVGIEITVFKNQSTANVSTTDLLPASLLLVVDKLMNLVKFTEPDPYAGLADSSLLAFDYPDLNLYHPWSLEPTDAVQQMVACDQLLRAYDARILPAEGLSLSTYSSYHLYANSHQFIGDYSSSHHAIACSAVVRDGDDMETHSDSTSACQPESLMNPELLVKDVAQKAIQRLGAITIATQSCPVLFSPPMAKTLLRSFIRAISGAAQYRQSSFLSGHLGQSVFPEWLSVLQQPHLPGMSYSAPFDNDGVRTQDVNYVENGALVSYCLTAYAARRLALAPTGNAGGVFNLKVTSNAGDLNAMCRMMGKGLLVTELMGQGTNIVSGNYSRGASGFWVENGEIQYPVSEITIAGNLKAMFKGLIAVGSDTDYRGRIHTGSILIENMTIAGQ